MDAYRWRRRSSGVLSVTVSAAALVGVLVTPRAAAACDWAGPPTAEAVAAALADDRSLDWFEAGERVIGVHHLAVTARSPAVPPFTSSRGAARLTRTWGVEAADVTGGVLNPPSVPYAPMFFIGAYGHGCSPLTHPAAGSELLAVSLERPDGTTRSYELQGAGPGDLDERWTTHLGDPVATELSGRARTLDTVRVWSVPVGLVLVLGALLVAIVSRRRRRRSAPRV